MKSKKLVLFGDSALAEIAYEYFTYDSEYEVGCFTVDKTYKKRDELFGLPIIPFEDIEKDFPPSKYEMHIALAYGALNQIREKKYNQAKDKGYRLANYISSHAFVWRNVIMGDNVFIFEDNTVQPFVKLGSNIVMWSGNHIGHHSTIGDNCFISSHVVVSGFCDVGANCFLGVNSSINNNLIFAKNGVTGNGAVITRNTEEGAIYVGNPARKLEKSSFEAFKVANPA